MATLEEIEQAIGKMTLGPWRTKYNGIAVYRGQNKKLIGCTSDDLDARLIAARADADGIVILRNAAPFLLAESRAAAKMREQIGRFVSYLIEIGEGFACDLCSEFVFDEDDEGHVVRYEDDDTGRCCAACYEAGVADPNVTVTPEPAERSQQ